MSAVFRSADPRDWMRSYAWARSQAFMPVALDLEFTRIPHPKEHIEHWLQEVQMISVGLAPARGRPDFYAAAQLSPPLVMACSAWTRENVLPLVTRRPAQASWSHSGELRAVLNRYLVELEDQVGLPALLVADWHGDLQLVRRVLGLRPTPYYALADLMTDCSWEGDPDHARYGLIRHNALDDAVWLRRVLGLEVAAT